MEGKKIDVSRWQGNINWSCMVAQGVIFAAMRATVANYYKDEKFDYNWDESQKKGIINQPYHVTRADAVILGKDNTPLAQMDYFAKAIEGRHNGVVVLDVELYQFYGTKTVIPKRQMTDVNMECVRIARQRYDEVYFYSRATLMDGFMLVDPLFPTLDLWLAEYGRDDGTNYGMTLIPKGCTEEQVVLHQYTSKAAAYCCESPTLDHNEVTNVERFKAIHKIGQPPVVDLEQRVVELENKVVILEGQVISLGERLAVVEAENAMQDNDIERIEKGLRSAAGIDA